jgi:hypothetical protein
MSLLHCSNFLKAVCINRDLCLFGKKKHDPDSSDETWRHSVVQSMLVFTKAAVAVRLSQGCADSHVHGIYTITDEHIGASNVNI